MPRKPKVGPAVLKIERLSDGVDPMLRDDTSGQPIPQPNARPPKDMPSEAQARKRKDIADKHLMLQALGIAPMTDSALLEARAEREAQRSAPKGMVAVRLGQSVGYIKAKPWRRV